MESLTVYQKILLIALYSLIILMIIFSVLSIKNIGEEGYNGCIQKKCEQHGEKFCNKMREINNCCMGAGGELGVSNNKYICVFK